MLGLARYRVLDRNGAWPENSEELSEPLVQVVDAHQARLRAVGERHQEVGLASCCSVNLVTLQRCNILRYFLRRFVRIGGQPSQHRLNRARIPLAPAVATSVMTRERLCAYGAVQDRAPTT